MNNSKSYLPFAAVAVLAASIGWGASALSVNHNNPMPVAPVQPVPAANSLVPVVGAPQYFVDPNADQNAATFEASTAPIFAPAPVAAPSVRRPILRTPVNNNAARGDVQVVDANEHQIGATRTLPVRERKRGMGNGTKTAIAIGGGAATGALLGSIAGGGKGAAIGALLGGGGGAVYSVIRKKQGKEVW